MLTPDQRRQLRQMTLDGVSVQNIARAMGISRTTVYAYQKDEGRGVRRKRSDAGSRSPLGQADQTELLKAFQSLRCNAAALTDVLHKDPGRFGLDEGFSLSQRNVRRYIVLRFPDAVKSRAPADRPSPSGPGRLQIDFVEGGFQFAGQSRPQNLGFVIGVYPWSRKAFVTVCPDSAAESRLTAVGSSLSRCGCPAEIVCENDMLPVVDESLDGKVRFHPDFEQMLKPFGISPEACRPVRPQTQGRVRRIGRLGRFERYFEDRCLATLQYANTDIRSVADLQAAIDDWIEKVADERVFEGKTVREWFELEKPALIKSGRAGEKLG